MIFLSVCKLIVTYLYERHLEESLLTFVNCIPFDEYVTVIIYVTANTNKFYAIKLKNKLNQKTNGYR